MKVTDLMVGDWMYSITDGNKKICKVKGIRIDYDFPIILCDDVDVWYALDSFVPIPLTVEILDKNFRADKQWGESGWFINDHIHIFRETIGVYLIQYMEIVAIEYVHELQHALKLCGIDKNIEL